MDWAAWRYWCSSRMRGSALESSTARTTIEPEWRMTSRRVRSPPGSSTMSVVTRKTGPSYATLDETTRALGDFAELDFEREDFDRTDFADFAIAAILRYAARVRRTPANHEESNRKHTVAIVGSGSLAVIPFSCTPRSRLYDHGDHPAQSAGDGIDATRPCLARKLEQRPSPSRMPHSTRRCCGCACQTGRFGVAAVALAARVGVSTTRRVRPDRESHFIPVARC